MKHCIASLVLLSAVVARGQTKILDRIAVSVGSQVITDSALLLDLRVTAFLDRLPVDTSPAAKRKAADRLVDQVLILREAAESRLDLPVPDAAALVNQVKVLYPSEAQYRADLQRYRLTEEELSAHLLAGARTLTFADLRFRPASQVNEETLRAYFDNLMQARAKMRPPHEEGKTEERDPTFEESRGELETLLAGQKSLEALDAWLELMRMSVRLEYREAVFQPPVDSKSSADAKPPEGR